MFMNNRSMPEWLNMASYVLAGLSLVLVVVDAVILTNNQSLQADVNGRAQYINQSTQLAQLNTALIRTLATAALNNKDERLGNLLAAQGITYSSTPEANPSATTGPSAPAPKAPPKP